MTAIEPTTVAAILGDPYLRHDTALIALAETFGDVSPEELVAQLDDAARALFGTGSLGLSQRAHAFTRAITDELRLGVDGEDYRGLLLDRGLVGRRLHPLLLAPLGHELARRAGLSSLVAYGRGTFWTILTGEEGFIQIGYGSPPDAVTAADLRSCCAHEIAYMTLGALATRAPAQSAALAARIRASLPVDTAHADAAERNEPR